jgi:hypothetical protein
VALAQRGRRISAVLVGEDSLEANVGNLALTGGEFFVAAGADLIAALESAHYTRGKLSANLCLNYVPHYSPRLLLISVKSDRRAASAAGPAIVHPTAVVSAGLISKERAAILQRQGVRPKWWRICQRRHRLEPNCKRLRFRLPPRLCRTQI